ncbi:hypothetical protein AAG906_039904 [Vitis piasezkii]
MRVTSPIWEEETGETASEDSYDGVTTKKSSMGKKMAHVKAIASVGLYKAKVVAVGGARKFKTGISTGIKWIKNQYRKKFSSESK